MCGPRPCDKPLCTWSEEWRAQCEARSVMRRPKEERAAYYADVKRYRGEKGLQDLIERVRNEWARQQEATQQGVLL